MEVKTLDEIDIYVLPNNAVCYASDGCRSPLDLTDCPIGNAICYPEGCANYDEVDMRGEEDG